jgi:histidine ammonia-lyase
MKYKTHLLWNTTYPRSEFMQKNTEPFKLANNRLTVKSALDITAGSRKAVLCDASRKKIQACKQTVETIVEKKEIVYGINTGFGPLCSTVISPEDTQKLQENILRSHSVGAGKPVAKEIAKLMLVLKSHALSYGYSGVSVLTIERILWHIENDFIPVVPSQGSVGASGDLAPLSHLFLPLIGLGQIHRNGSIVPALEVLKENGKEPLKLGPKEGLALINGTQFMAAHGVAALDRLHNCLDTADIIGAMTLEALLGSVRPFRADLHKLRPYAGTRHAAHRLSILLKGSEMVESHSDCTRVQDPYSLRCMPQVHGASRNAWLHLKEIIETEINSVTDNPIVLDENTTISGGHFHGQPIAVPMDYAAIAAAELGNISDRRTYLLLEGGYEGLPKLLMKHIGINSGFMIPQYTSAALVSENKVLCHPASCDSIPTSLGQEDHVSMGAISGRKLNQIIDNLENILAVELLCAAQAFDYRRPMRSSAILEACHQRVREKIDHAEEDRVFADDLEKARRIIQNRELTDIAQKTALNENIDLNGETHDTFSLS